MRLEQIPLVERYHQAVSLAHRQGRQAFVLVGDLLPGIRQQHDHVAVLQHVDGTLCGIVFHRFLHARPPPEPRGVHDLEPHAICDEAAAHRIPGRAGRGVHQRQRAPGERVEQRRLPGVGPPEQRKTNHSVRGVHIGRRVVSVMENPSRSGETRAGDLCKRIDAAAVGCGDRHDVAEAEFVEPSRLDVTGGMVGLVDRHDRGLSAAAKILRKRMVVGGRSVEVDDQQDHVGRGCRLTRARRDLVCKRFVRDPGTGDTARVHQRGRQAAADIP